MLGATLAPLGGGVLVPSGDLRSMAAGADVCAAAAGGATGAAAIDCIGVSAEAGTATTGNPDTGNDARAGGYKLKCLSRPSRMELA